MEKYAFISDLDDYFCEKYANYDRMCVLKGYVMPKMQTTQRREDGTDYSYTLPPETMRLSLQENKAALLKQLKEEMGLSILFISHDLRVVYQMCNHVMIMQKGQFVEMGVPEEIYFAPKDPYTKKLLESAGIE